MNADQLPDIQSIRKRARAHLETGAVTPSYRGDRKLVLRLLNEALASELVCVLRYKRHYFMSAGLTSHPVAAEFQAHAVEELAHADLIAGRIIQLGGEPNFHPEGMLFRSHTEYVEGAGLVEMVREDLVAERIAVESYTAMIHALGDTDPTTRRMLEEILAKEEEHADEMSNLLVRHDVKTLK